jgi:hypothetical protein
MRISPTQIGKLRQCERIIGFEYVEDLKAPATEKMLFGKNVHKQLEKWLSKGVVPDKSSEGRVADQGIQCGWLPVPSDELLVECKFEIPFHERTALIGYIDCVIPPLNGEVPVVIDHKSTSDLRWAKTSDQLVTDPQALIYCAWAALEYKTTIVKARWIYYAASNPARGARKPRGAKPVELALDVASTNFQTSWALLEADVMRIVDIRGRGVKGLELDPSPESCGAYGGCFYRDRCNLSADDRLVAALERDKIV